MPVGHNLGPVIIICHKNASILWGCVANLNCQRLAQCMKVDSIKMIILLGWCQNSVVHLDLASCVVKFLMDIPCTLHFFQNWLFSFDFCYKIHSFLDFWLEFQINTRLHFSMYTFKNVRKKKQNFAKKWKISSTAVSRIFQFFLEFFFFVFLTLF